MSVLHIMLILAPLTNPMTGNDEDPSVLPQAYASDGWIQLYDGATLFGWNSGDDVKSSHDGGTLKISADPESSRIATTSEFANFELEFQLNNKEVCHLILRGGPDTGSESGLVWRIQPLRGDDFRKIGVKVNGPSYRLYVDDSEVEELTQDQAKYEQTSRGIIGLAGSSLVIRDMVLRPLETQSLFNGKDLTGWEEIPDRKSVFSVNKDGHLNVKDGNGDLQTTSKWDDFILQMDISSNGDHLNSGIFFRGDSGTFWSGYESQIRNEWLTTLNLKDGTSKQGSYVSQGDEVKLQICVEANGRVRPTKKIETILKADISEVVHHRNKPVDFGTGGIYNRQPSRYVVPTDREWFTKTVVAADNHIAVWINGYQVSDFTDSRARGMNARTNQRLEAGHISIQGHDPTTDLSFRRIRIAAYPKK